MKAVNLRTWQNIADDLTVADTLRARMQGLLGRNRLLVGEGLWIKQCMSVHTFGMKFPIDVIFLDKNNAVVAALPSLPPYRITRMYWKAASVLELPSGILEKNLVTIGDSIEIG